MEQKQEPQNWGKEPEKEGNKKGSLEGIPMEDSPYVNYKDLEDYKRKGYGTEGHLQPEQRRGAGASTDAPTLSGTADVLSEADLASTTNAINRQGVP